MTPVELHAFNGRTGAHIGRLRRSSLSWEDALNAEGRLSATVARGELSDRVAEMPYWAVLAAVRGDEVLHAGYLVSASHDAGRPWEMTAGGPMTILQKRLVVNHDLDASWRDGTVVVDEDNPSGSWLLSFRNCSYSDLVSRLLRETLKFGELPFVPAPLTGGDHERNYNSYDFATVADRVDDIMQLSDGPEVRFDPVLSGSWTLSFVQRTESEIVDRVSRWNALLPGSPAKFEGVAVEGDTLCTQCYAVGGRDEDRLLVARSTSTALTSLGWPVLQAADVDHASVSELATLRKHAAGKVAVGTVLPKTSSLIITDPDAPVSVGDWANVREKKGAAGVTAYKVVGVSGSVDEGGYARTASLMGRVS